MPSNPTFATAIHEAGHAVARLANQPGPRIHYLSIIDQPDGMLGVARWHDRWLPGVSCSAEVLPQWRRAAHLDIVEALAGPVAELRQRHRAPWSEIDLSGLGVAPECFRGDLTAGCDLDVARIRLSWLHEDEAEAQFHSYWCEAVELVRMRWRAIDQLARKLLERGRVEGDDVHQWWDARDPSRGS